MAKLRPAKYVGGIPVHKLGKSKVTFQKVCSLTNLLRSSFAVPKLMHRQEKPQKKKICRSSNAALQMPFQTIQNSK